MKREQRLGERDLQRWLGDSPGRPVRSALLEALDRIFGESPKSEEAGEVLARVRQEIDQASPNVVYYDTFEGTPFGELHIAVSDRGVLALSLGCPLEEFLAHLKRLTGLTPRRDPGRVARAGQQVREYLQGRRKSFDLPVDLRPLTPFQRRVLERISALAAGEVATYGQVAAWLGKPGAARAVGQALARNPVPLIVPCHRVLASDGSLGGYSGGQGPATKLRLLQMEGAPLPFPKGSAG